MEQREMALLVGVNQSGQKDHEYTMKELRSLAYACDTEVVGEVVQNLDVINASHYIGSGKLDEVKALLKAKGANLVICNDELTPSQIRNLEKELECKLIDRTALILDIFARRARTKEAQMQVEIAQLKYMLPRLVGLRESLGRQSGGVGTCNRGSGEKKLELDRRKIGRKIAMLNEELESLVIERQTQRKLRERRNLPVVSLVGYTNAGKSTLMNAVLDRFGLSSQKKVFEKDMLFATLETSARNIRLSDNKSFVLTDTVGFISKLPHHLIKAFRSTLEEIIEADLIIHVIDGSSEQFEQQMEVTHETLKELGAQDIPMLNVFNKADLLNMPIPRVSNKGIYVSAKNGMGIDELTQKIRELIFKDYVQCEMIIPYQKGALIAYFNENAHVLSTHCEDEGMRLSLECRLADQRKYQAYIVNA